MSHDDLAPELFDPEPIEPFYPAGFSQSGWEVSRYVPGERLRIQVSAEEFRRQYVQVRVLLVVGALVTAGLGLFSWLARDVEAGGLALMGGVFCALCLVLLFRAAYPRRPFLEVEPGRRRLVMGFFGRRPSEVAVPLSGVQQVQVKVHWFEGSGSRSPPRCSAELRLVARDGELPRGLELPKVARPGDAFFEVRDELMPLACALGRLVGVPVAVSYAFNSKVVSLPPGTGTDRSPESWSAGSEPNAGGQR